MPGTLIAEARGAIRRILFFTSTALSLAAQEFLVLFLVLGVINGMRFLAPVFPGDRLEIAAVDVLKIAENIAIGEGSFRSRQPSCHGASLVLPNVYRVRDSCFQEPEGWIFDSMERACELGARWSSSANSRFPNTSRR